MQRLLFFLSIVLAVTSIAAPAQAECPPPVEPGSTSFNRRMRTLEKNDWIVVRGTVADDVPPDAHNIWSIFIDVDRYIVGSGPKRITVTNYGDGLVLLNKEAPGSAIAESRQELKRLAGKDAIVFAKPEYRRYAPGYSTTLCSWNRFGPDADEVEQYVRSALGLPPAPPVASRSAPGWLLVLAAIAIVIATGLFVMRRKLVGAPSAGP